MYSFRYQYNFYYICCFLVVAMMVGSGIKLLGIFNITFLEREKDKWLIMSIMINEVCPKKIPTRVHGVLICRQYCNQSITWCI